MFVDVRFAFDVEEWTDAGLFGDSQLGFARLLCVGSVDLRFSESFVCGSRGGNVSGKLI